MSIKAENYAVIAEPHAPFPISNFSDGLWLAREPWLAPAEAFRRMENCHTFRGQVIKRSGFSMFSELSDGVEKTQTQNIPTLKVNVPGDGDYWQYTLQAPYLERPVVGSIRYVCNAGTAGANIYGRLRNQRWSETGYIGYFGLVTTPGWVWDVVAEGTTDIIGSAWLDPFAVGPRYVSEVCWEIHPSFSAMPVDTTPGEIRYKVNPETEIVGLYRFKTGSNEYSICCDPDYVYKYNLTTAQYERQGFDGSFAGPFTGTNSDYFWYCQVDDYVLMTNNVDPVCKWDPSLAAADSVVEIETDWNTPATNELDTCLLIFQFAGRTVFINTVESAVRHHTRARWTEAGATAMRPEDYTDAPMDLGAAVTGKFIGERLFVSFEKGWMELVRRPGDAVQAFEWRPVISRFGSVSKLCAVGDNERILSRSSTSMQSLDPNGQTYLDVPIPDLVLEFSTRYQSLCSSFRSEINRSFWWTYASKEAVKPDHILCAVYDEQNRLSWSQYDIRMNVFSDFAKQGVTTWNSLGPRSINSYTGQSVNSLGSGTQGTERTIGGQSDGIIYVFDDSVTDQYTLGPETIKMVLQTQKLFPFPGQKVHFGWLDILMEIFEEITLKISFFANEKISPYLVREITVAPDASYKAYARLSVGRTAASHQFTIETVGDTKVAFDAFVPWFRKAGRIRKF